MQFLGRSITFMCLGPMSLPRLGLSPSSAQGMYLCYFFPLYISLTDSKLLVVWLSVTCFV